MVQGVIFDMDGLMFDTERLALAGWLLAGERMGLSIDGEFVSHLRGRNTADGRALYQKAFGRGDYDAARAIRTGHMDAVIARGGLPVKPGLLPLLEELRGRGLPAALATGTARVRAAEYLRLAGVEEFFSASVCGDEVIHAKPAPDIFLEAAKKLGLPPERCMVLEDSPNGLAAAHAAGCLPVMIPDLTPPTPELERLYAFCVPCLSDVLPLLDLP